MESPWHLKVRFALQKYGFREFMILSSLKNVNKTLGISMNLVCSLDVQFQHVNKTYGISMILVCSPDVQFQNVNNTLGITMILVCQPISQ